MPQVTWPHDFQEPAVPGVVNRLPRVTVSPEVEQLSRGSQLVFLAERDGDPDSPFLVVSTSRDTWYVGRDGMRGTDEGPETAAELRAVLPRILRPVTGAPDLSGF